jgi:hypothetical protein
VFKGLANGWLNQGVIRAKGQRLPVDGGVIRDGVGLVVALRVAAGDGNVADNAEIVPQECGCATGSAGEPAQSNQKASLLDRRFNAVRGKSARQVEKEPHFSFRELSHY